AFAVFVVLAASHFVRVRHLFEEDFLRNAKVLAQALDGDITSASDFEKRDELLVAIRRTMWLNPDVVRIDINVPDGDGLVTLVSSMPSRVGQRADARNLQTFKDGRHGVSRERTERGKFASLSTPIRSAKRRIGTLDIVLILEVIDQRIFASMFYSSIVYFFSVFVSSVLLYLFIRNSIIKRLDQLRQAVGVYGREGVLPPVDVGAQDEIGDLARDISQMTADHSETQQRLRQAQRLEAVGQLTGGIAHDFNNIITVVQGNAELLAKNSRAPAKLITPILQAAASGSELIKRLLAFSRKRPLSTDVIAIDQLVREMSEILSVSVGEDVDITFNFEEGLWPVKADYGEVENAVLNLMLNARDAMPDGGSVTIEGRNVQIPGTAMAVEMDLPAGDYVALSVIDTGTGMSKAVAESAFDPFFTTKDVDEGSGLGLSMVYGFAQQSGGQAGIVSNEGEGATVCICLPRADASSDGRPHKKS
ncbi:MAG: ATP-binding protein, partial [Pseudomonadota bacterium]